MSVQFVNNKLTEELRRSGASVTTRDDKAYKNFLNPKETPDGQYYRLRLLYFTDPTNKRTIPFVEKFVHTVYNRDENGKLSVDYVTCPTSPYLKIENAWKKCPCCQYANKQYELADSSDWKNKTAAAAHRKMRRDFVSFVPVYVINDPNVPENAGRVMILNIRDRDAHEQLTNIIKSTEYTQNVFNGQSAVDLAIVVKNEPITSKKTGEIMVNQRTGEPYTKKKFKFKFSDKAYDIDIPIEQVDELGFDESMYTYNTENELLAFLTKHTIPADIPEDDIKMDFSDDESKETPKKVTKPDTDDIGVDFGSDEPEKTVASKEKPDIEISDDIEFDMKPSEPSDKEKTDLVSGDIDLDDVLGEFEDLSDLGDDF